MEVKKNLKVLFAWLKIILFFSLIILFTWQTSGNHVNSNNKWLGTRENFDLNIRTNSALRIVVKGNGDIGLSSFGSGVSNKYRLFINNSSGDVGIGSAPSSTYSPKFFMRVATNGDIGMGFLGAPLDIPKYKFKIDATTTDLIIGDLTANAQLIVKANGNVGIGTNLTYNPNNYKLAVKGMIGCRELKIEISSLTWADFVFEKNYKLMPLKELEDYIKQKKHLPNVPSVSDVEANNGIEVGQIQTILLQKIEELT